MEYVTRERFSGLSLKTTGWTVSRFGPQNPSLVPAEIGDATWRHQEVRVETKLSLEGCVVVGCFYLGLDHNALGVQWFGSKYL
jgi:hypothetical protein